MGDTHLSDGQLERFVIGVVHDDAELKWIEDHLFHCPECAERMEALEAHLDDPDSGSGQTTVDELYRDGGPLQ
jgi:hypothetical protein